MYICQEIQNVTFREAVTLAHYTYFILLYVMWKHLPHGIIQQQLNNFLPSYQSCFCLEKAKKFQPEVNLAIKTEAKAAKVNLFIIILGLVKYYHASHGKKAIFLWY